MLKLNADGTVDWQKTYGGSSNDYAYSVQQTADGGYIVAGVTYSFGAGSGNAWVLKLNADGTVAWQKTYGGTNYDYANAIQQTADGGYIVAGRTDSFGAGIEDAWVLKLDLEGGIIGCGTIGGSNATTQATAAAISNSTAAVSDSAVSGASFSYTVNDTSATTAQQCSATYTQYFLDVYTGGSGTGVVTSSPSGINCGSDCRGIFTSGVPVTLSQAAEPTSTFAGWQGACSPAGQVTVNSDSYCVALFNSIVDFFGEYRSGLVPLTVNFTDLSSNNPTGWFWSFGDGGTSLSQNPGHTYLWPGTYTVSLSVTGPGGSGSISKSDYVTATCESGVQTVRYGTPPSSWTASDSIQSAYNASADGDYIEPMSVSFYGDLSLAQAKKVTLKGGFNCAYSSNAAMTTVIGVMTIGGPGSGTGGVTVENIILR